MHYALAAIAAVRVGTYEAIGLGKLPLNDLLEKGLVAGVSFQKFKLTELGEQILEGLGGKWKHKLV